MAYRNGKFSRYFFGLTPRLIVGACQEPIGAKFENEQTAYEATKQIFEDMKYYNEEGLIVTSNQCDIHNGPVIQLTEADWHEQSISTSFDEIWERYGTEIVEGAFGINDYDKKILKQINDCI